MKQKPHILYIGVGYDETKIGITSSMTKRVAGLKSCGMDIDIHCVWHLPGDARAVEVAVMRKLSSKRVRGKEWFAVTPAEMVEVVKSILHERNPKADVAPLPAGVRQSSHSRLVEIGKKIAALTAEIDREERERNHTGGPSRPRKVN